MLPEYTSLMCGESQAVVGTGGSSSVHPVSFLLIWVFFQSAHPVYLLLLIWSLSSYPVFHLLVFSSCLSPSDHPTSPVHLTSQSASPSAYPACYTTRPITLYALPVYLILLTRSLCWIIIVLHHPCSHIIQTQIWP